MATFEVTQVVRRTATVHGDSISDALTLAKEKFEKPFGYMELATYTVQQLMPMPEGASAGMQREETLSPRKLDR